MNITISATNNLAKWLKLDLPRLPAPPGKQVGVEPLVTDANAVAWQCHAVNDKRISSRNAIIAMEARSRYAIVIPLKVPVAQEDFEDLLIMRWASELAHLMVDCGAVRSNEVPTLYDQFLATEKHAHWVKNTDLSVNAHILEAEHWVREAWQDIYPDQLNEEQAFSLGSHFNTQPRRLKKQEGNKAESFLPAVRLIDDGLYRFASGLSGFSFPATAHGDFPSPYPGSPIQHKPLPDNVVSMDAFLRKKR